jgi:molecular chaperone GrpE
MPDRFPVTDKRSTGTPPSSRSSEAADAARRTPSANASSDDAPISPGDDVTDPSLAQERTYLEDLQRLQAEFENFKKRQIRERTELIERATAQLVERLLPVLDLFEAALAHGEGGKGIEMVHADLRKVLDDEGLSEILAQGQPFDPSVHEAFEAVDDPEADHPVVRSVSRKGYALKGRVLRPAMVVVARRPEAPPEKNDGAESDADGAAES